MPRSARLQAELERIAAERLVAERESARATRREFFRAGLECAGWCGVGLVLMATSMHVTDEAMGRILFYSAYCVGYGGMLFSLIASYNRAQNRGDL
ncbi:MAG TPA: hypothetical protein VNE60_12920 [Gemmatimonadaceae bacterium]|nr:hypothetical protein [Gemmatimonadaceae bacterium]